MCLNGVAHTSLAGRVHREDGDQEDLNAESQFIRRFMKEDEEKT